MQITCQSTFAAEELARSCDLLVVAVAASKTTAKLDVAHAALPAAATKQLVHAAQAAHFLGRVDEQLVLHVSLDKAVQPLAVALLGLGEAPLDGAATVKLGGRAMRLSMARRAQSPFFAFRHAADDEQACMQQALWLAQGLGLGAYDNVRHKSPPKPEVAPRQVAPARLRCTLPQGAGVAQAITVGQVLARSVNMARDWVNMPPNALGPPEFAAEAMALGKANKLRCKVLDEKALQAEGMNLHLAVGQGSARPPRLVHIAYSGDGAAAGQTVALIGKGITFDSGGLCIKPCESMSTMKMDMGGAAAVLATVVAAAQLQLPVNVHGVLALAENMPSGNATRPGDIFTSAAGTTVEINNTDAEGRLVLADALTWARRHLKPDVMVDVATLTGACMVALGPNTVGLMSNEDKLAQALKDAAAHAGEDIWRLPLTSGLREQLKSDVADMRNTGERYGGAITAGLFLQTFVGEVSWAHLDIAGPAWATSEAPHRRRGGTGAACATLVRWLMLLASGEHAPLDAATKPGKNSVRRTSGAAHARPRRRGGRDR